MRRCAMSTIDVLEVVEIDGSDDEVKADPQLVCRRCGALICDVEHGDSIGLLVHCALDHLAACSPGPSGA